MGSLFASRVFWGGVLAVAVLAGVGLGLGIHANRPASQSAEVPAIGGPFTLTDHNDRTVRDTDFRGSFMLVFFGYTYCPDVCPTGLTTMSEAMDRLGDKASAVQPLFVTIDPDRDVPDQLKEYVGFFHPRILGLTGDAGATAAIARAYRVYYAKVPGDDPADAEDYRMDHSTIIYFMGPQGRFITHFRHDEDPMRMAERMEVYL